MTRTILYPALVAATLAAAPAVAAPILPVAGASSPVESVVWRGGNWHDHPMMYSDYWHYHQRQWDRFEGRRGAGRANVCARLRGYNPRTHTYVNRSGRRVACR